MLSLTLFGAAFIEKLVFVYMEAVFCLLERKLTGACFIESWLVWCSWVHMYDIVSSFIDRSGS
jgi:hypothetical protein